MKKAPILKAIYLINKGRAGPLRTDGLEAETELGFIIKLLATPKHLTFTDEGVAAYDRTRSWPDPMVHKWCENIMSLTGRTARILDVGTGTGNLSIPLSANVSEVVGLDVSFAMLQKLHLKQLTSGSRVIVVQGDVTALPFRNASFNCVLTTHLWNFVADWSRGLMELKRVLRNCGLVIDTQGGPTFEGLRGDLHALWRSLAKQNGANVQYPGAATSEEVHAALSHLGGKYWIQEVGSGVQQMQVRELLGTVALHYRTCFRVPKEIHCAIQDNVRTACLQRYTLESFTADPYSVRLNVWKFDD